MVGAFAMKNTQENEARGSTDSRGNGKVSMHMLRTDEEASP